MRCIVQRGSACLRNGAVRLSSSLYMRFWRAYRERVLLIITGRRRERFCAVIIPVSEIDMTQLHRRNCCDERYF